MGFKDCLYAAMDRGAISRQEAGALGHRFDEEFAQARLALGDEAAAGATKPSLKRISAPKAAKRAGGCSWPTPRRTAWPNTSPVIGASTASRTCSRRS